MTTTKLSQWGTGQGFHVTKAGMEITGTAIGDLYEVEYLPGAIIFSPSRPAAPQSKT